MGKINPIFLIGTFGMLITSMLHILMAAILPDSDVHSSFWILYPVSVGFLIAGTVIMAKRKEEIRK